MCPLFVVAAGKHQVRGLFMQRVSRPDTGVGHAGAILVPVRVPVRVRVCVETVCVYVCVCRKNVKSISRHISFLACEYVTSSLSLSLSLTH